MLLFKAVTQYSNALLLKVTFPNTVSEMLKDGQTYLVIILNVIKKHSVAYW